MAGRLITGQEMELKEMKGLAQADSASESQHGTGRQASLSTEAPHATAQEARLVPTVQEERGGGRASGKTSGWCHLRKGRLPPPSLTRPLNLTAPHLLFGTLPPRES